MKTYCSIPPNLIFGPFRASDIIIAVAMICGVTLCCLVCTYIAANNRASRQDHQRNYRNDQIGRG